MRKLAIAFAALTTLGLGACAANRAHMASAGPDELQRLEASCKARGGHLELTGRSTAYAVLNNICKITDPTKASPPRDS